MRNVCKTHQKHHVPTVLFNIPLCTLESMFNALSLACRDKCVKLSRLSSSRSMSLTESAPSASSARHESSSSNVCATLKHGKGAWRDQRRRPYFLRCANRKKGTARACHAPEVGNLRDAVGGQAAAQRRRQTVLFAFTFSTQLLPASDRASLTVCSRRNKARICDTSSSGGTR